MICAHCQSEYAAAELGLACPTCGKSPSEARIFLVAEAGDADAMFLFAEIMADVDVDVSRYYLHRASAAGCRAAALVYAKRLLDGSYGEQDAAGAKSVLAPYVKGSPRAGFLSARAGLFVRPVPPMPPTEPRLYPLALRLASDSELVRDFETASAIIRLFAERRDGEAALLLASLYETGRMVKEDLRLARHWYLAAWEMGNSSALVRLGDLLTSARLGGTPDYATAVECYLAAEEAGNIEGAIRLGDISLEGRCGDASVRDALVHYRKAEGKSDYADERIREICRVLDESYRRAVMLQAAGQYERAAAMLDDLSRAGHAEAANRLGYFVQNGLGVKLDRRRAASLYALAAERKSKLAIYNLGVCYAEGIGLAFSYQKATRLLEMALEQGVSPAEAVLQRLRDRRRRAELRKIYSLACLLYRRGDFVASSRLLRAASEAGDLASMHRLACHLRRGDGIRVDLEEADALEKRAISLGYRDTRRCEIGYLRVRREHELAGRLAP